MTAGFHSHAFEVVASATVFVVGYWTLVFAGLLILDVLFWVPMVSAAGISIWLVGRADVWQAKASGDVSTYRALGTHVLKWLVAFPVVLLVGNYVGMMALKIAVTDPAFSTLPIVGQLPAWSEINYLNGLVANVVYTSMLWIAGGIVGLVGRGVGFLFR